MGGPVQQRADVAMIKASAYFMTPKLICKYRRKKDEDKKKQREKEEEEVVGSHAISFVG